jgi:hypothetical protein
MMDRQKVIVPTSPRAPDPLCARLLRETTIYFMELIDAKDREIAVLRDRLDPGNYCSECDYIGQVATLERKVQDGNRRYSNEVHRLTQDIDRERMERMDAEEDRDKCVRKNRELIREKDRGW